jgi:hypothetical protein
LIRVGGPQFYLGEALASLEIISILSRRTVFLRVI